jgi:hypothetical protein
MSCFWDSLVQSISQEDKTVFFDNNLNLKHFVTILKNNNILTHNIIWNNQILTDQHLKENKEAVDTYDINNIYNGYYCSTCDPFLLLLSEFLLIEIQHNYNNNLMIYKN